jgi:hypothetical protein
MLTNLIYIQEIPGLSLSLEKLKLSLKQAMKAHRVVLTSRLPHFLDNGLKDGGEVVIPTRRPPFTPRKIPGINFC